MQTEFWLGNEKLAYMTAQTDYEIRFDLRDKSDRPFYAVYSNFRIGEEKMFYRLILGNHFTGDAGDSLRSHENMFFTTYDEDHDTRDDINCARAHNHGGGWWFHRCDDCNLNGQYGGGTDSNPGAMEWDGLDGSNGRNLRGSEMKIRPLY